MVTALLCGLMFGLGFFIGSLWWDRSRPPVDPDASLPHGVRRILIERRRQITEEGFTLVNDDGYTKGELTAAASCYLAVDLVGSTPRSRYPATWPWSAEWWKPSVFPERNLERAAALIAAELDRRYRAGL